MQSQPSYDINELCLLRPPYPAEDSTSSPHVGRRKEGSITDQSRLWPPLLMCTPPDFVSIENLDTTGDFGVTVFGGSAGEIMSATQIAMIAGLPYTALRDAILAHPTFVEGLHALFSSEPSGPSE